MTRPDVTPLLRGERATLIELLERLDADQWSAPTECPEWSVAGIANHLVGDDLSLLARQRDDATNGLLLFAEHHPGMSFRELLDGFNQQWVTATGFLGARITIELLRLCGEWTAEFYESTDAERLGEPVPMFAATDTSPFWQIIAREYIERWAHQLQIRRALGEAELDSKFLLGAVDVITTSLAIAMADIEAPDGERVGLTISGLDSWTFERSQAAWLSRRGHPGDSHLVLGLEADRASVVLSRGIDGEQLWDLFSVTDSNRLVEPMRLLLTSILARP